MEFILSFPFKLAASLNGTEANGGNELPPGKHAGVVFQNGAPKLGVSDMQVALKFGRVHQTLRVTPAMEAGIADHVWSVEEIVGLLAR